MKKITLTLLMGVILSSYTGQLCSQTNYSLYEKAKGHLETMIEANKQVFVTYKKTKQDKHNSTNIKHIDPANQEKVQNTFDDIRNAFETKDSDALFVMENGTVKTISYYRYDPATLFQNIISCKEFDASLYELNDRVRETVLSISFPILSVVSKHFEDNEYIGVIVSSGLKATNNKDEDISADCIIVIVKAGFAKDYFYLKTTEESFASACDIYVKDGTGNSPLLKKMTLKFCKNGIF